MLCRCSTCVLQAPQENNDLIYCIHHITLSTHFRLIHGQDQTHNIWIAMSSLSGFIKAGLFCCYGVLVVATWCFLAGFLA